ncbi:MAG: hypothetical protein LBD74_07810 [Spirochaetaceae bacterium]|nr:hypothetical protein [Spirochaetaceae bacterium]
MSELGRGLVPGGSAAPVVIRCRDCTRRRCALACEHKALSYILGDLLVEAHKCPQCTAYGGADSGGIPPCIRVCPHGKDKAVRPVPSSVQKRIQTVEALPLLTI